MLLISVLIVAFAVPAFSEDTIAIKTDGVEIKFNTLTQFWLTTGPMGPDTFTTGTTPNIGVGRLTPSEDPHTYRVRRAELRFSGKIEGERINWMVMLDPGERPSDPLQDAYVELKYIPKMGFRVGQFKVPFSMETLTPSSQLDFVERAKIIRIFSDVRDIGAFFFGDYKYWEWQFGEINGEGQNTPDDDDGKKVFGHLVVKPTSLIHLGSSIYFSGLPDFNNNFRLGTELKIDTHLFGFRAEALWERFGHFADSLINTPPLYVGLMQWGGYTTLLYKPFEKHQVCLRVEWLDEDTDVGRDATFLATIGYNFFQTSRVKWQANFINQTEQRGNRSNHNIYFGIVNLQVSF